MIRNEPKIVMTSPRVKAHVPPVMDVIIDGVSTLGF